MVDSFDELQVDADENQGSFSQTETDDAPAYDNQRNTWIVLTTGAVVLQSTVISQMRLHTSGTFSTLDVLTNQLYDGQITVAQWQLAVAREFKDAHLAQAMYGAGGRANMTSAGLERVRQTLNSEYGFLNQFANDIANGTQSRAQALARVRQYGRATQQSFWREYREASSGIDEIWWDLNPAEHCLAKGGAFGCVDLANGSPYTKDTLPTVPGGGATTCKGNCNCTLRREKR